MNKQPTNDLLEMAWVIIANSFNGDWELASNEWKAAAEKWRDEYHETLDAAVEEVDDEQ